MDGTEPAANTSDLEALRALQADTSELERLESLLDRFNVFEAIGFTNDELMHSRFLAVLLDTKQNHAVGDLFLRSFLRKSSESTSRVSLSQTFNSINDQDLGQTRVQTEVYTDDGRIDILLLNESGEWAMIIENKVWSTEHSDQLDRYYRFVKKKYPTWDVFGVYLTPFSDTPSHEAYAPFGYAAVCDLLDSLLDDQGSTLNADVQMAMKHYTDMVRRNIVGDSEVTRLAQQIYRKHQRALDLVYEQRSAHQEAIRRVIVRLINETPYLTYNTRFTHYPRGEWISFYVQGWEVPALKGAEGAYRNCILLFVFANLPDRLVLTLQIGPGDEETRKRLFHMACGNRSSFGNVAESLERETKILSRPILTPEFYEGATQNDREQEIRRQWARFLNQDLPRIEAALKTETWIWESVEPNKVGSSQGGRFVWGEGDIEITKRPEDED